MKILLVEDDPDLGRLLSEYLKMHEFEVVHAIDGKTTFDILKSEPVDLATIDIMLPDIDGLELAKSLKTSWPKLPFIFLTAKNRKEDIISGLKLGADDYITKPFEPEELVLRINVALKRNKSPEGLELKIGQSVLQMSEFRLVTPNQEYKLTQRETELLGYMIRNRNRLIKREILLKTLWGENDYFLGRSMDVFISRLRKYFKDDPSVVLETFRGTGYLLKEV
ncbi:MAG: response regulator transcription factor [Bacteroidales bacterium]|nr:response regulator transcription factor [Bacteroidales bacterium]